MKDSLPEPKDHSLEEYNGILHDFLKKKKSVGITFISSEEHVYKRK